MSSATRKSQKYWRTISTKQQLYPQWHMVGMLGDKKMWAKPDEHHINEDTEMDTRKNKKRPHQKCYHPREEAHIKPINTFLMKKRLSWFGHVQRRDHDNVAKSVLNTRIDGSRPRGRPKLRWMDRLKYDMNKNNIRPEWASYIESWFNMMKNVNPTQETTERWETLERTGSTGVGAFRRRYFPSDVTFWE